MDVQLTPEQERALFNFSKAADDDPAIAGLIALGLLCRMADGTLDLTNRGQNKYIDLTVERGS